MNFCFNRPKKRKRKITKSETTSDEKGEKNNEKEEKDEKEQQNKNTVTKDVEVSLFLFGCVPKTYKSILK